MRNSASLRSRSIRTGTTVAAAVAAAGVVTLAGAPAASAIGESGDIDIRSVSWHSRGERNGVEVCQFVLVANNFGALPELVWTITERPPGNTLTNTLPLIDGKGRSQEYLLPEGTYQLSWPVGAVPLKTKSFEVDCSRRGQGGSPGGGEGRGSSESGAQADTGTATAKDGEKGAEKGAAEIYDKPSGAVPAGGGGVPDLESVSSESDSNIGTSAALVAGAAGIAGLIMVRRSAARRARNEA
ncbi:hypothetical protein [Streptomyces sp. NBC_00059]|uniref:hypothetical protein n=1 Tax=Streptomyces sp. NBC_00059 TaxID=2975635 RepID=UPI00224F14D6|nr:hypothetical protein [Streptomyces sp. NBC_00059]MCX5417348.1 hypothetical protein [Streptomyces sp. NBC_00059]